ncbi:MAG: translation initiation factor IF-2 [Actinomycetes bacterium]|nr:translation initiation factor IF-2 [Actinomycetes bacterium]
MAGMKVYELAKEIGMKSSDLLEEIQKLGIPAKTTSAGLVDAYIDIIRKQLAPVIAERQAAVEAERAAAEAEERRVREEAEAKARAEEEARRKAEEDERRAREEERRAKEEERIRLEAEAKARAEAEAAAAAGGELVADEHQEAPQPMKHAEEAKEKKVAKPKAAEKRDALKAAIAAEAARIERENAAKREAEEAQRYREMALAAEKLQKEKVLAEMRAEVEAAQTEATSKRSKKKKKKVKGAAAAAEAADAEEARRVEDVVLPTGGEALVVTEGLTVGEFAELLEVPANDIIKTLFMLGTPLTVNQPISNELIDLIAEDLEREVTIQGPEEEMTWTFEDRAEDMETRSPVVTVMGHVDHGKTSLLDAIRETGVVATEAGGITQHIGASVVEKNGRKITFIDTPGHEAFTAMRARGANITDVVILVVAADDGVMPQTVEAISHAKAAGVPIVVAVNKVDKENANPDQVRQMLTEYEVVPEEWGGANIFVNVSAKKRQGIDDLLEMVLLQADILELKANPNAPAFGTVIEAKLDKGRGPVATVLVRRGTLRTGDALVAGATFGRVRALIAPDGRQVKSAGPSDPVEVLGLANVPAAGDDFLVFADERKARALADDRAMKQRLRAQESTRKTVSLDDLFAAIEAGELKDLNLVVKADVQGSIEALRDALDKMDQSEVRINIIHAAVGGITETDVQLAAASNAIIIGFNVRPNPGAKALATEEKVDVRTYRVIYQAIEEINAARVGLLAPEFREVDTARVEVRELFKVPKMGVIAGSYVLDGEISRDDKIRIVRDSTVVYEGVIGSLRRFKDDVKTVRAGYECGVGVEGFQDLKVDDIIESYRIEEVAREA